MAWKASVERPTSVSVAALGSQPQRQRAPCAAISATTASARPGRRTAARDERSKSPARRAQAPASRGLPAHVRVLRASPLEVDTWPAGCTAAPTPGARGRREGCSAGRSCPRPVWPGSRGRRTVEAGRRRRDRSLGASRTRSPSAELVEGPGQGVRVRAVRSRSAADRRPGLAGSAGWPCAGSPRPRGDVRACVAAVELARNAVISRL